MKRRRPHPFVAGRCGIDQRGARIRTCSAYRPIGLSRMPGFAPMTRGREFKRFRPLPAVRQGRRRRCPEGSHTVQSNMAPSDLVMATWGLRPSPAPRTKVGRGGLDEAPIGALKGLAMAFVQCCRCGASSFPPQDVPLCPRPRSTRCAMHAASKLPASPSIRPKRWPTRSAANSPTLRLDDLGRPLHPPPTGRVDHLLIW